MASSLNRVELIGRLGKDPEIRHLNGGSSVANFSVATSESWKDKRSGERVEKTEWHRIVVWNENTIKFVESYLKKGDLVRLEGKLQTREWEDNDGNKKYATEVMIPAFAPIDALMKLSFDNDNRGGSDNRDDDRGSSRGGRNNSRDDRDDRGGNSRSSGRSSSRDDRDDRGGSRGRDDRDDRGGRDDRGSSRGGNGGGNGGGRNNDLDDDIPF
ncbi:single-stranded DNA-binding protein [Bradyrhizobium hipponense]|uniref:Single-stranded DNA-binding protein n=1 Tax=Bradyrhizobium hipponense TaxID=2605638 RepID=A0A5S4YNH7_9BRAD|nr:single-stranded DNA-binding protein [Bradyrhizobium hipponense]TYO65432.1 single-stranded DNA-binding protein [Bradyrhizobium hipponense]